MSSCVQSFNSRAFYLACLVQVVLELHARPQFRTRTKRRGQSVGHIGGDTRRTGHDPTQRDTVNAELDGSGCDGRLTQIFPQDFAGVRRIFHSCHFKTQSSRRQL